MAPVSTGPPPVTTHMPPTFKPPPVPPPQDEGGDVYEAPDITSEPEPSGYTCFQPVTGQEEPQVIVLSLSSFCYFTIVPLSYLYLYIPYVYM